MLYPLKFEPILKHRIWGGSKLKTILGKKEGKQIGESWELSGVEGDVSVVSNGKLQGISLNDLIEKYKEDLLGKEVYQSHPKTFPLLFKFIDALEVLSVQVHPGDRLAEERHQSYGKTEMWYILQSRPESELLIGFKEDSTPEEYLKHLHSGNLPDLLHKEKVKKGDAFLISPGTIHAIGKGILLAEIQQTSDITYRIYDWDRKDQDGNSRELHTDMAIDAIDFSQAQARMFYREQMDVPVLVGKCDYFAVNKLSISKTFIRDLDFAASFKVYMCLAGEAELEGIYGSEKITKGETVLIPAQLSQLIFHSSGASFLEIYIP